MPESADKLFQNFVKAESYIDTKEQFTKLCNEVELNPDTDSVFYTKLKQRLVNHPHYAKLWKLIDQRRLNDEYMMGTACKGRQVLVIGAGPCGLRMAIECAFLGARVTVLEAREYFSRNNVLYLWRYVKTDLKALGVKIFSPQFCTGGLDHISIRALQLFLLKISLLLGVKIYCPLKFVDLVQPAHGNGWRVKVDQPDHPVSEVDFDVIVGGEGKRHTLAGYSHKTLRGRLAIAVTANIVNARTKRDVKARELGGLSLIFDQEFFKCLAGESGVDLENFVYFKSDTHYFVMTIKKKGLLKQGILLEDKPNDPAALLARNNVNWDKLKDLSRNIIDVATERKLEGVPFAKNHHGQDDLAIFDFTSMRQAQNSCFAQKINGKKLLTCIVGDALLEPFWPQGTGCARGFLGVFDGAWLIRNWCQGEDPVKCIAEREAIFSLLSQTKNEALKPKYAKYTIDPKSRYHSIPAPQVAHASRLYVEDNVVRPSRPRSPQPSRKREAEKSRDTKSLLQWYKNKLKRFENIAPIKDLNESWKSGVALLSVVQLYRPDLIDISVIDENAAHDNCRQALILIEQEFGVTPSLKAEEICGEKMNKWALLTYLALLQERLAAEVPLKKKRGSAALSADSIASDPGASNMEDVENYLAKSLSAFRVLKTLTQSTKKATLERAAERQAVWSNSLSRSAKKKDKGLAKLKNSILLSSTLRRSKSKPLQSIIDSVHMKTSSLKRNKSQPNPKVSESTPATANGEQSDPMAWMTSAIGPTRGSIIGPQNGVQMRQPGEMTRVQPHPMSYRPSIKHCKGVASARISAIRASGMFEPIKDGDEEGRPRSFSSPPEVVQAPQDEYKPRGQTFTAANEAPPATDITKPSPSEDSPKFSVRFQSPKGSPRDSPVSKESPGSSPPPDSDSGSEEVKLDYTKSLARQACKGKASNLIAMFQKGNPPSPQDETDSQESNNKPQRNQGSNPLYDNLPRIKEDSVSDDVEKDEVDTPSVDRIVRHPYDNVQKDDIRDGSPGRKARQPYDNVEADDEDELPGKRLSKMRLMSRSIMACRGKVARRLSAFTDNPEQINEEDADSESEEEEVANMCYICDKILFVVNRVSAHGKYFHRDCFKCATCDTHLRVGDSFELKDASEKVQLYCQTHYFMSGAQGVSNELLSRSMKRLKLSDVTEGDTSTDQSIRLPPEITITEPADEETSSEDEVDLDSLVAKNMGIDSPTKPRKHVMFSDSSVDSSDDSDSEDELDVQRDARMLIADEIQQGLEEVEEEEEELQERGVKLEKKLVQGDEDQQVVNEWLAISVKQNKLKEKASKLMLKKKLMELTEMINRCQLEYLELVDDDDEDELQLKTDAIDKDIQELTGQMKSVKMFLNRGESAS